MIVTCKQCGKTGDISKEFAGREVGCSCGNTFTITEQKCPFCGEYIKAEAVKCRYCQSMLDGSNPQADAVAAQIRAQKDTTYRILCLFFGMLGVHDIYAGYGGRGALKMILTVVGLATISYVGWIPLLAVGLLCLDDLSRGLPKPESKKVMIIRLIIFLLILAGFALVFFRLETL